MRIVVNGGHCPGRDPGACSPRLQEADVCRRMMELAVQQLRGAGHEVLSVQSDALAAITGASNGFGAELFIAIHCNAAGSEEAQGTEVYYASEAGSEMAAAVQDRIVRLLGTANRGTKEGGGLYVLRHTVAVAILVETAFITNPADEELLLCQPDAFSSAITAGVLDFIG